MRSARRSSPKTMQGSTIVLSIAAELRRSGQGKRLVIGEPYHGNE